METVIIICVIAAVVVIGVISSVKHFKGEGGCCGGGGYRQKKKKLSNVLYTKTFTVEGMHCVNCKNRVEDIVNNIKGVAGKVDLKSGTLTVSYSAETDDSVIISRIEKAGYTVK